MKFKKGIKEKIIPGLENEGIAFLSFVKLIFTSWHFALCFLLAGFLIDGWPYVAVGLGLARGITWLLNIGLAAEAILWFPLSIEKPLVFGLAILFQKWWFPKDKQLRQKLEEELHKSREEKKANKKPKE